MSLNTTYDAIIVGGGVLGASAFFHISQKTSKVCLIDAAKISGGCTRYSGGIVRCFHFDPLLLEKAIMSWKYYKSFALHTGINSSFETTGFLYFPRAEQINFAKSIAEQVNNEVPMQWLKTEELQAQFGTILSSNLYGAIYEPMSGYMDAAHVTKSWIEAGSKNGGHVFEATNFTGLTYKNKKLIGIETSRGTLKASAIIIAAGPQTPSILDRLEIPHEFYSQIIQVDRRLPLDPRKNHPAFIDDCNDLNGRPESSKKNIYIGYPTNKRVASIADVGPHDANHSKTITNFGRRRWNWVETSSVIDSLRSADCYTSDGRGYVASIKEDNLYLATGFSGGGFKVAPWVGREIVRIINF